MRSKRNGHHGGTAVATMDEFSEHADRRHMQESGEEVSQHAELFRPMVENVPINVMYADTDLVIRYLNKASKKTLKKLEHLLPCKVEEIEGKSIDFFHKNPAATRKLVVDPKSLPYHATMQLGPETLSLVAEGLYDAEHNYLGPMVTWEVVTEKLRLETMNADYAAQIAALNKAQPVGQYKLDGTIIEVNDKYQETFGYSREELVGKHISTLIDRTTRESAEYKSALREQWAKLNRGEPQDGEARRWTKDGRELWISYAYTPIFDAHGKPYKVVNYFRDITAEKIALNAMISDAAMLSKAAVEGKLATRADASKHQGDYRKVVEGVNSTLDAVIGPLNVAADYVDKISKGNIPAKITDSYNGDFNTIKNNLNTCIDAVNALVADAGMLSKAAVEGKLATRADAGKHGGDFRKIVEGVNGTLDAVMR